MKREPAGVGESALKLWAMAVEVRDPFKRSHAAAVAKWAAKIGEELRFPGQRPLRVAALLHDIGKGVVPESTLLKPDRLNSADQRMLESHCSLGEAIVSQLPDSGEAALWVRDHHEHYDGKGYPNGLEGDAISLGGRILAVADAFDAMTHDRAYRSRMTPVEAKRVLREGANSQWDPKVVEAALKVLPDELPDAADGGVLNSLNLHLDDRMQEMRKLALLTKIGEGFRTLADPHNYTRKVLDIISETFPGYDGYLLALLEGQEYRIRAQRMLDNGLLGQSFSAQHKTVEFAMASTLPTFYTELPQGHPFYFLQEQGGIHFVVFVPLTFLGKPLGFVALLAHEKRDVQTRDVQLFQNLAATLSPTLDSLQSYAKMEENVITDPLTGAYTWHLFNLRFVEEISRARRYNEKLSFLFVHFTDYDRILATHGETVGEGALRALYSALSVQLRASDFIARYGEDDFIVMLPVTPFANANIAAGRVQNAFRSKPVFAAGKELAFLRLGWGTSVFPDDGFTIKELVEKAASRVVDPAM